MSTQRAFLLLLASSLAAGCSDGEPSTSVGDAAGFGGGAAGASFDAGVGELDAPQLFLAAQQAAQAGNDEKAVELFRRVIELQPDVAEARFALGTLLVPSASAVVLGSSTIDYEILDEAIGNLEAAVQLEPGNASYQYWLGRALDVRGENDRALEVLAKAVELNPDYPKAHKRIGLVHAELGHVDEARAAFERARELGPGDAGVVYQLGNLALAEDPERAKALYQEALELNPRLASAYHGLSQALTQLGDESGATAAQEQMELYTSQKDTMEQLARAADAEPGNVEAQFKAGEAYFVMNRFDNAAAQLERVLMLQPDHAMAHYYFGLIRMSWGEWEMAMNHLEETLYFAPDMIGPRIELVRVYRELANDDRIGELTAELDVMVDGADADTRNAFAEVLLEVGRKEEAMGQLESVLADDPENEIAAILVARARAEGE